MEHRLHAAPLQDWIQRILQAIDDGHALGDGNRLSFEIPALYGPFRLGEALDADLHH